MTYWPWKNECSRWYQHHIKKAKPRKAFRNKNSLWAWSEATSEVAPSKQNRGREGGREGGILGVGQLGGNLQIRLHFYFPEESWDCFSPCAPAVPRWVSWSYTPHLQSCLAISMGCRSAGDAQHIGSRPGNTDARPQNMHESKLEDKGENHSDLHSG